MKNSKMLFILYFSVSIILYYFAWIWIGADFKHFWLAIAASLLFAYKMCSTVKAFQSPQKYKEKEVPDDAKEFSDIIYHIALLGVIGGLLGIAICIYLSMLKYVWIFILIISLSIGLIIKRYVK